MGIDPGYVLDRMEIYEMHALMEHRHQRHRESWEQTRMLAFIMANCAGAKLQELKDIFRLPWDDKNDDGEKPDTTITREDVERLSATARWMIEHGHVGD